MSLKSEAIKRFLTAAKSLANQGLSKEAIMQFARNEFGQINELFQKQIDNIFKPKQGIENIKIKDEVFDDTVVKLPVDDTGQPFNPNDPLKQYGKPLIDLSKYDDAALNALAEEGNKIKIQLEKLGESGTNYGEFKKLSARKKEIDDILSAAQDVPVSGYDNFKADLSLQKQTTKNKPKKNRPDVYSLDDYDTTNMSDIKKQIIRTETKLGNLNPDSPDFKDRAKILIDEIEELQTKLKDEKPRTDKYTGGMVDVEPNLSDIGHGSDALMARTRLMSPGAHATTSTGLNYLLAEDNDNIRVPFSNGGNGEDDSLQGIMMTIEERQNNLRKLLQQLEDLKKGKGIDPDPEEKAEGGRIGFAKGNGVADEEAANAKFAKRVRQLMDEGFDMGEAVREAMKEGYAEGGRIGFSKGKLADIARRQFMKAAGAGAAGLAALKTGLLGFGKGAAPVATEAVKSAGSTASAPPPYFFKLMEKIKLLGEPRRTPSYRERVKEYQYTGKDGNEYLLTEELDTGDIMIQKDKIGGRSFEEGSYDVIEDRTEMVFRKGQMDETTKGKKPSDEYEEYKVEFDQDGTAADATNIDEISKMEIVEEAGDPDSLTLKKADGGRIGFNKGKLAIETGRKFLEKVFGKETFENMIRNDPEMYRGMLEVVEMFRNRDKEGLKMYLQKFLPHMDDAKVEDFIIGSGDTAGIEGQLIRLGSGRDYAGKIEMIKRLERNKALRDLEVTEEMIRKPNASGGIAKLLGE